jgi:hypothetical protein
VVVVQYPKFTVSSRVAYSATREHTDCYHANSPPEDYLATLINLHVRICGSNAADRETSSGFR